MYKVNLEDKALVRLTPKSFSSLGILERFDIQEWIEKTPDILGEELLVIAKELALPSGIRLDLLAIDKQGNVVVVELKRDDSGRDMEWQAIKYALNYGIADRSPGIDLGGPSAWSKWQP